MLRITLIGLFLAAASQIAAAQSDEAPPSPSSVPSPWSANVAGGALYDSNIAVLDLDRRSGKGDAALTLDGGFAYTWRPATTINVRAGYDLSQILYADLSEFNLRMHRGSLDASYDVAGATAGAMLNYVHASLDGREFLVFQQASPYVSQLVGERLYLRGAYEHTRKDFAGNHERDAQTHSLSADAFFFVNGLRTYLAFGYRLDSERATADFYDFRGHRLSAQLVQRVQPWDRELISRTRLRYEHRDYRAVDPALDAMRRDRRYRLETLLEIPLNERLTTTLRYEFADNRSNLPAVDLSRHLFSAMLGWNW